MATKLKAKILETPFTSLPPSLRQRPKPPARLKSDLFHLTSRERERDQTSISAPLSSNIHYTSSGQNSPGSSVCSSDDSVDSPISGSEIDLSDSTRSPLSALNKRKSLGALLAANTLAASSSNNNIIVNSATSTAQSNQKDILSPTFRARNNFQKTSPSFSAQLPTPDTSGKKIYNIPTSPRIQQPSAISTQIQKSILSPTEPRSTTTERSRSESDNNGNQQEILTTSDREKVDEDNDADAENDLEDDIDESWHSVDEDFGGETSAYHSDSPALPLVPFTNQVGGHASFLRFSNKAICKPVSENEQVFYEYLEAHHPEVLPFIPAYLGVLNVTYRQLPKPDDEDRPGEIVPEVVLEKNRHIVTDAILEKMKKSWKWPSTPGRFPGSTVDIMEEGRSLDDRSRGGRDKYLSSFLGPSSVPTHSSLPMGTSISNPGSLTKIRGLTRINLALKEKVLKEVLSPHSLKARAKAFRQHFGFTKSHNAMCSRSHDSPDEGCADYVKQVTRRHSLSNLNLAMASRKEYKKNSQELSSRRESISSPQFSHGSDGETRNSTEQETMSDHTLRQPTPRRSKKMSGNIAKNIESSEANNDMFHMDDLELPETMFEAKSTAEKESSAADIDSCPAAVSIGRNQWILDGSGRGRPDLRSDSAPQMLKGLSDLNRQNQQEEKESPKNRMLPSDPVPGKYILLEDLTDGLKAPCILDIKMGTRQYGIWASEKKMKSQTRKCQKTTSYETGIRICGMQVYNKTTGLFLFQNKYYGRKLTQETLPLTLREFLFNGSEVVICNIPPLHRKIRDLAKIIKTLNGYRFYASSLLIYYDGNSTSESPHVQGTTNHKEDNKLESAVSSLNTDLAASNSSASVSRHLPKRFQERPRTDLKVIDFAHCTPGIYDKDFMPPYPPMHPQEPDKGYLLGLKNLMRIFRDIWDQNGGDPEISQVWLNEEEELWAGVWD
ncbi:hypothetical protein BGZ76_001417 [Entomortierella beljakovae]|nr:hypothetical protein BGZ76_001417 [Entomortierella beljakovae]